MNRKILITAILMWFGAAIGGCGEHQADSDIQEGSSKLHYLYDNNFTLRTSPSDANGRSYFFICIKNMPSPNCYRNIFMDANGGRVKFNYSDMFDFMQKISAGNYKSWLDSRRKRNRHMLRQIFHAMFRSEGFRAEYPISMIVMELAWYLLDSGHYELKWVCPPVPRKPVSEVCMPVEYVKEYYAAEKGY